MSTPVITSVTDNTISGTELLSSPLSSTPTGLLTRYKCDEADGFGSLTDTGGSNDLTVMGTDSRLLTAFNENGTLQDGSTGAGGLGNYRNISADMGMNGLATYSLSMWVYIPSFKISGNPSEYLFNKEINVSWPRALSVSISPSTQKLRFESESMTLSQFPEAFLDNSEIPTKKWVNIIYQKEASVGNSTDFKIYVDNVSKPFTFSGTYTSAFVMEEVSAELNVGSRVGGASSFDGRQYEVQVYNKALNASERIQILNGGPVVLELDTGSGFVDISDKILTWGLSSITTENLSLPGVYSLRITNNNGTFTFIETGIPTINLPECSEVLWPIQPQNVTNRFVNRADNGIWQGGNRTNTPNTSKTVKLAFRIDSRFAGAFETELIAARQIAHTLNIPGYDFFNDGFSTPLVYVLHIDPPIREQAFYRYDVIFKKVP